MVLTNQKLVDLYNGLMNVGNLGGAKFSYAISRNLEKLSSGKEAVKAAFMMRPDYIEYEKARLELAEKHSVKKDGKIQTEKVDGAERYILKDEKVFAKELEVLKEKYKKVIEGRETQLKEFADLLKDEVEIDLYKIPPSYLPKDITPNQTSAILAIIDDSLEENLTN